MSEILKDQAVVLRTYDFGESSLVTVALTRVHGKMRFLAKGAKREKSAFFGNLRTGNLSDIVFYFRHERELQLLKEIESQHVFDTGGDDFKRLCIFQAGLEIVDRSVVEREADERIFDLLEGFIKVLPAAADPWSLLFTLQVRLLKTIGLFPSTTLCVECGKDLVNDRFRIDPASGSVTCENCGGETTMLLSAKSASLLELMVNDGYDLLKDITLQPNERKEIGEFLHYLFLHHIDGYRLPYALKLMKGVNAQ